MIRILTYGIWKGILFCELRFASDRKRAGDRLLSVFERGQIPRPILRF
jgi:hypothetical protein